MQQATDSTHQVTRTKHGQIKRNDREGNGGGSFSATLPVLYVCVGGGGVCVSREGGVGDSKNSQHAVDGGFRQLPVAALHGDNVVEHD